MSDVQADQAEQAVDASPASTEPAAEPAQPVAEVAAEPVAEQAAEPATEPAPEPEHAVHGPLQRIEDIAIQWGGEIGTELRNLVGKIRAAL